MRMLAALAVTFSLCAAAHAQSLDPATAAKIEAAVSMGKDINDHDQSAWHVTDELMALKPDAATKRIGYVTERVDATHVKTLFLLTEGAATRVYFTGVVEGSKVVSTENFINNPNSPPATPDQIARMNAVRAVNEAFNGQLCGKPLNTVVLPVPDDPGSIYVYALASETDSSVIQFGGHLRLTLGPDGKPKGEVKRYSNTCIAMKKDKNAALMMITVPSDIADTPTEMHVFKSLSHGMPLIVSAGEKAWEVSGARIQLVDIPGKPN